MFGPRLSERPVHDETVYTQHPPRPRACEMQHVSSKLKPHKVVFIHLGTVSAPSGVQVSGRSPVAVPSLSFPRRYCACWCEGSGLRPATVSLTVRPSNRRGQPSMRKRLGCFCTWVTVFWASDDGRHYPTYTFLSHSGLFLWPLSIDQDLAPVTISCHSTPSPYGASWRSFVARDRGHRNAAARTYCACGQDFVHPNQSVLASSVSLQSMSGAPRMLWCLWPVKNKSIHCRGRVVIQFVAIAPPHRLLKWRLTLAAVLADPETGTTSPETRARSEPSFSCSGRSTNNVTNARR